MKDAASTIISHEQTQSDRVCGFLTFSLFKIFRDQNRCPCAMWPPLKVSPYIDIVFVFFYFLSFWTVGFNTFTWEQSCAQRETRGMSHLPLSLMNRHNKTKSADVKLWMLSTAVDIL